MMGGHGLCVSTPFLIRHDESILLSKFVGFLSAIYHWCVHSTTVLVLNCLRSLKRTIPRQIITAPPLLQSLTSDSSSTGIRFTTIRSIMSDFDGSSRSASPVSQEPSAPSPVYEYPLPPSQENLAPYYPPPRPTTGIFLPTVHLASSPPTRTSSGGRSNNENQANLASTHEEVDSLTNSASLGLVNMASLPTIPESRQQPHSSAENQNQTFQVLSRTQTEPKTKRNRRNAKEDPLFGVSRQLTLGKGYEPSMVYARTVEVFKRQAQRIIAVPFVDTGQRNLVILKSFLKAV